MNQIRSSVRMFTRHGGVMLALACLLISDTGRSAEPTSRSLDQLLDRTGGEVSKFLDQLSQVKCTEQVSLAGQWR